MGFNRVVTPRTTIYETIKQKPFFCVCVWGVVQWSGGTAELLSYDVKPAMINLVESWERRWTKGSIYNNNKNKVMFLFGAR